jgi:dTDP-4-amino-4,6-dideoxygalactose transaminase
LPFSPPFVGEEEIRGVTEVLRSGWISRGPVVSQFEEEFRQKLGAPAALGLNSGTAGLHLGLQVMGIGPGDEVIVPTITFCASANVVEHVGAKPVLVDVMDDTLNIDPLAVEAALTDQTRAIMIVHFGGHPAEMDALIGIAERHGLKVIEDAAHAFPASYRGEMVGSTSRMTAFSFYATKNLTTGEGGMLTGDPEFIEQAATLSLHGMSRAAWNRYSEASQWYYEVAAPGYKYNMADLQAAVGRAQLLKLEFMDQRRREVVRMYADGLRSIDGIRIPCEKVHVSSAWHLYPIRVHPDLIKGGRDAFIDRLSERNIGTSVHFIPLHLHPFYRDKYGHISDDFPIAQEAFKQLVSLPLHPGLTDEDVSDVIEAVKLVSAGG